MELLLERLGKRGSLWLSYKKGMRLETRKPHCLKGNQNGAKQTQALGDTGFQCHQMGTYICPAEVKSVTHPFLFLLASATLN